MFGYIFEQWDGINIFNDRWSWTLQFLDLSINNLTTLNGLEKFSFRHLNMSYNPLFSIEINHFKQAAGFFDTLISLDLSHTSVSDESTYMFKECKVLEKLILVGCPISKLKITLPSSLTYLDITLFDIQNVEQRSFDEVYALEDMYVSNYKMCCPQVIGTSIPPHVCHIQDSEAISSCDDLIREPLLRIFIWIVGLFALAGNLIVIVYRLKERNLQTGYELFVLNLSCSDLLMGVYLIIIAQADAKFRGSYIWHDDTWRHGLGCQLAQFCSSLSSEASSIFIFLITVDRFLVIKFPFGQFRLSPRKATLCCVAAWTVSVLIAIVPLLPFSPRWDTYTSSAMCVSLPLTSKRPPGWLFMVIVFVCFNFLLFVLIACGQFSIYRASSTTRSNVPIASESFARQRLEEDLEIARRLSLIVITDFLCWFPVGVMGLMALNGHELHQDAYAWTAVLIIPINSAINPILYTIPILRKKWALFKDKHVSQTLQTRGI